jgi:xylulose-5-phosphate/fructose-6-phosphate phosphoketolase
MVVLNQMSRFDLAAEAIRRVPRLRDRAPQLIAECKTRITESVAYAHDHLEDPPEIRDWVWTDD